MTARGECSSSCRGSIPIAAARARPAVTTTTSAAASVARKRAESSAPGANVVLRLPALR